MPLHPDDVVRKTFRTTSLRRGYDENDVDAFLEEIVAELRRLRRQVDEAQAEIDRLHREGPAGVPARMAVEEQQLEQVRRERDALAAELRDAEERIAQAHEDVSRAESDRDAKLEEIQARFDEDLSALKKRARETREEARQLVDDARVEEDRVIARLAAIRAEVERIIAAEVGEDRVAALISGLRLGENVGPAVDLSVVAALVEALRAEHVAHGRAVAREIRAEAEAERERMLAQAREERDRILADRTSPRDQMQGWAEEFDGFQNGYR